MDPVPYTTTLYVDPRKEVGGPGGRGPARRAGRDPTFVRPWGVVRPCGGHRLVGCTTARQNPAALLLVGADMPTCL
eukprot:4029867-Pyramimonas_sp.AAC.1